MASQTIPQPGFQTVLKAFKGVSARIIELPEAERPAWRDRLDRAMAHADGNAKLDAMADMTAELAEREMGELFEKLGVSRD